MEEKNEKFMRENFRLLQRGDEENQTLLIEQLMSEGHGGAGWFIRPWNDDDDDDEEALGIDAD